MSLTHTKALLAEKGRLVDSINTQAAETARSGAVRERELQTQIASHEEQSAIERCGTGSGQASSTIHVTLLLNVGCRPSL